MPCDPSRAGVPFHGRRAPCEPAPPSRQKKLTFPQTRPKKSLGQHFLRDENAIRRIVDLLNVQPDDHVAEIGPGPGALTDHLRSLPWKRLLLMEKDDGFAAAHAAQPQTGLEVIHGDALAFPWETLEGPWKIVGNLPYNVASPLIWDMVSRVPCLERAVFMIQKEVADRILAGPGSRAYGALTAWVRSYMRPTRGFNLGPGAFSPPPKVDSAVIVLTPLPRQERPAHPQALASLLKICFQQRRKQLQHILRHAFPSEPSADILRSLGIPLEARPETLDEKKLHLLTRALLSPLDACGKTCF